MTEQNGEESKKRVQDEEQKVDTKIKSWIIKNRQRVDDAEEALFVDAVTDPNVQLSHEKSVITWGTIVKQFLRSIEPILRSDDVEGATKFYKEVEIGREVLYPPNTDGYQFEMLAYTDKSDTQLRRMIGLPRGVDLPEPEPKPFIGLQSIIEAPDVLEHRWAVTVENTGAAPNHKEVYPHARQVISKDIFVDAVRYADQFLQEAGIGLDLEEDDTPIIRGFDHSQDDGDGSAEMDKTNYRGDPGI